jgi:hypothetical protein
VRLGEVATESRAQPGRKSKQANQETG